MNSQTSSAVTRLGARMIDFALESAGGRGQIERSVGERDPLATTALVPTAWFESALLWVGLRLRGSGVPALP